MNRRCEVETIGGWGVSASSTLFCRTLQLEPSQRLEPSLGACGCLRLPAAASSASLSLSRSAPVQCSCELACAGSSRTIEADG